MNGWHGRPRGPHRDARGGSRSTSTTPRPSTPAGGRLRSAGTPGSRSGALDRSALVATGEPGGGMDRRLRPRALPCLERGKHDGERRHLRMPLAEARVVEHAEPRDGAPCRRRRCMQRGEDLVRITRSRAVTAGGVGAHARGGTPLPTAIEDGRAVGTDEQSARRASSALITRPGRRQDGAAVRAGRPRIESFQAAHGHALERGVAGACGIRAGGHCGRSSYREFPADTRSQIAVPPTTSWTARCCPPGDGLPRAGRSQTCGFAHPYDDDSARPGCGALRAMVQRARAHRHHQGAPRSRRQEAGMQQDRTARAMTWVPARSATGACG